MYKQCINRLWKNDQIQIRKKKCKEKQNINIVDFAGFISGFLEPSLSLT